MCIRDRLYTSVLAAAIVPPVLAALKATSAQRIFVANIANEKGEARGFGLGEHLEVVADHGLSIDVVLTDMSITSVPVSASLVMADLAAADGWSHDSKKLGAALSDMYETRHVR